MQDTLFSARLKFENTEENPSDFEVNPITIKILIHYFILFSIFIEQADHSNIHYTNFLTEEVCHEFRMLLLIHFLKYKSYHKMIVAHAVCV